MKQTALLAKASLTAGVVLASLVTGATVALAGPAVAAGPGPGPLLPAKPTNCRTVVVADHGGALCESGGGQHRAVVTCDKNNWFDYDRYGAWVANGKWSYAYCDFFEDDAYNVRVEKR